MRQSLRDYKEISCYLMTLLRIPEQAWVTLPTSAGG
jgi:hypothetical protein